MAIRLRMVVTYEFDVDPKWYEDGATPEEMGSVERDSFLYDSIDYIAVCGREPTSVVVEPIS